MCLSRFFPSLPLRSGVFGLGTIVRCLFPQSEPDRYLKEHIKMASQEESVREFVAVTDVDEERARFFLESAGWNLQVGD